MAGAIEDNAVLYKKKPFTYVPPSPPAELIETTSYTLDFASRKFVHIGIDPTEKFKIVLHIITSSRYVHITPDCLKTIFSYMGRIFSTEPQTYKRITFYEDLKIKLSNMMYSGENVLVIESKTRDGCRVLLNLADLMRLQYLECCIFESIIRKEVFTAPLIIKQYEEFATYVDEKCALHKSPPKNIDEMRIFIQNMQDDRTVESSPNFTSQIQMCAAVQLAESLLNLEAYNTHDVIDGPWIPDQVWTPSPFQTTYAQHPTPIRCVQRQLF